MTEIEGEEAGNASIFKATYALLHVLLNQIKSNDELRMKLNELTKGVILQLSATFGYSDDIFVNLRKEALESAQSVIDELNEEFGRQSPACQVDQHVERVTRKRQRDASETPFFRRNRLDLSGQQQRARDPVRDNFEDRFVNDSVDSPMRGDIVPRRFNPNPAEVENPRQYVEEESLGGSTRQSDCNCSGRVIVEDRFGVATGVMPDRASITKVGGAIESVRDESSTAPHSEVSSVSLQPANDAMALRIAKSELFYVENDFRKNGCGACNPPLLPFMVKTIDYVMSGNQRKILLFLGPMDKLIKAKVFCAKVKAMHCEQKATKVLEAAPVSLLDRDLTVGECLHQLGKKVSDTLDACGDWTTLKDAIGRRNADLDKSIDSEKYCVIGNTLKNRVTLYLNLCIVVTVMSELRLCEFCNPNVVEDMMELCTKVIGSNVANDFEKMTVESLLKVLVPALNSGDETLAAAALRIIITIVGQMKVGGAIVRSKFCAAQRMRLDNNGLSEDEGRNDYCGGVGSTQSKRRSDMLHLWFCIFVGRQIEAEFQPGFFARHGSFARTLLRESWRNFRYGKCSQLLNEEFFTNLSSSTMDKTDIVQYMEKMVQRSANDQIHIIISDNKQLKALQLLCA